MAEQKSNTRKLTDIFKEYIISFRKRTPQQYFDLEHGTKEAASIYRDVNKLWVNDINSKCLILLTGLQKLKRNKTVKGTVSIHDNHIAMDVTGIGKFKFTLKDDELLILPNFTDGEETLPEIKLKGYNTLRPDMKAQDGAFTKTKSIMSLNNFTTSWDNIVVNIGEKIKTPPKKTKKEPQPKRRGKEFI